MQRNILLLIVLLILLLAACSNDEGNTSGVQEVPVTVEVTRVVEVEVTRIVEVEVTREVAVEITAQPTATSEPASASEPALEPIILTGSGNAIVDIEKWDGAAALHIIADGAGFLTVDRYFADGESRGVTAGYTPFDGVVALDFGTSETTTRFGIEAPGDWTLQVLPMSTLPVLNVPGKYEGSGRMILALEGETPDLAMVTADDIGSYFYVTGYGYGSGGLIFFADNERVVGTTELPFEGTGVVSADTKFLAIETDSNWSIEVAAR